MIHCSGSACKRPVASTWCKFAWLITFVRPSAVFFEFRTKPMSEIAFALNPSRAAAMLNIVLFSDVREPFYITSNKILESVNSCTGMSLFIKNPTSSDIVPATSNMSLNAMTSPARGDRVTRRDLYELNKIRMTLSVLSPRKHMYPNCEERSSLFAKDESEKPLTLNDFR